MSGVAAPAVEVAGFGYTFASRDRPTLRDVSFSLRPGTWTVVAGRTGSGKSTLLRALCGLIPRLSRGTMEGMVRIAGHDVSRWTSADAARHVGLVLQSPDDQLCTTTVRSELAFGLENLALPVAAIERRIVEAAAQFGFSDELDRPTSHLSGGRKQRLVLAAIGAMRPSVLVCDEPLSQLDTTSAQELLIELRRRCDEGMTVVTVEHRFDDLLPAADRLLVLDGLTLAADVDLRDVEDVSRALIAAGLRPPGEGQRSAVGGPRSDKTLLRLDSLAYQFPRTSSSVWSNVSLDVHAGERIAIVGPNGSGKSTLLAVMAGLLTPTSGRIVWSGDSPKLPTVLVPQRVDLTLFNETVAEELAYGPRWVGLAPSVVDERVRLTAGMFDLADLLDEPPHALSQGRRVRTAIAAAVATAPRVLLLDEPTTGQDSAVIDRVMTLIGECLGAPGGPEALVFTTHDRRIAARYSDRIVTVRDGGLFVE